MLVIPTDHPDTQDESRLANPSRRLFLTGLGALCASTGLSLVSRSAGAQWEEPPMLDRPAWSNRIDRRDRPASWYNRSYPQQYRPSSWYRPPSPSYNRQPTYPQPGWQNRQSLPERPFYDPNLQVWAANDLNVSIQRYLTAQRQLSRVAENERTAWLVYDFTSGRFLATINADLPYQSASMIKPFIALAFFHKVQDGAFDYTPYQRERMEAMIQYSDNRATNHFIALLNRTGSRSGPGDAEHTLKRSNPGMFRHTRIVEYIPRSGRTYRNRASALDYHRFLQALWHDQLPYSSEIKRLMNLPNRDRVYTGAREVPQGTLVFDKTGTTARLCGDMGILVAQGRDGRRYPYTFIGIIEKARPTTRYGLWKNIRGDVIREVSNITYNHLRRMYDLV
jgi:beta-lactamase class A